MVSDHSRLSTCVNLVVPTHPPIISLMCSTRLFFFFKFLRLIPVLRYWVVCCGHRVGVLLVVGEGVARPPMLRVAQNHRLQAHLHCCLTWIFCVKWNMRDRTFRWSGEWEFFFRRNYYRRISRRTAGCAVLFQKCTSQQRVTEPTYVRPKAQTISFKRASRRFSLPSLHILHVRCQFCVIRAVRRNLQFLPVWVRLRKKSIVQRDGQAQERAQAKLERNRRWFERKISTFLVRAANAPVRAANAPYGELHTSTNSRSSNHERREHNTKRLWSGRGPEESRSNPRKVHLPIAHLACLGKRAAVRWMMHWSANCSRR